MTGRTWQGGSTRSWRRTRARVLARDGWVCRLKVQGVCTHEATHVHHVLGRKASGDDERYLVAACEACNLHTGDPTRPDRADPDPRPLTRW